MNTIACRDRLTVGQVLAGMVALVPMLLFTHLSSAGGDEDRTIRLLLEKHIRTQEEYDQAVQEEERAKAEEE